MLPVIVVLLSACSTGTPADLPRQTTEQDTRAYDEDGHGLRQLVSNGYSSQEEQAGKAAEEAAVEVQQSRELADCILVYLKDEKQAELLDWEQPSLDEYEAQGCKSLIPTD